MIGRRATAAKSREGKQMFEPTTEPAKSLYLALIKEMDLRKTRGGFAWIDAERAAIFNCGVDLAQKLNLRAPTLEEVTRAENCACGHTDYAAKFAYGVAEFMVPRATQSGPFL